MMIVSEMDLSFTKRKKKKTTTTAGPDKANRWRRAGRTVDTENDDITLNGETC